jgi:HEAT repeat protein
MRTFMLVLGVVPLLVIIHLDLVRGAESNTVQQPSAAVPAIQESPINSGANPGLYGLSPRKRSAGRTLPELLDLVEKTPVHQPWNYGNELFEMGPEAITAITQRLQDANPDMRAKAALILSEMGPKGKAALPTLVQLLKNPDQLIRTEAVRALYYIGSTPPSAAPELLRLFNKMDYDNSKVLGEVLGRMGARDAGVSLELLKILENENDPDYQNSKSAATIALGRMGPSAAIAIPAMIKIIKKDKIGYSSEPVEALARLWPFAAPEIQKLLQDDNPLVRGQGIYTLGNVGPEALPDLIRCLRCPDEHMLDDSAPIAISIERAFYLRTLSAKFSMPWIIKLLDDPDPRMRLRGARIFCTVCPDLATAVRGYRKMLTDDNLEIRQLADEALRMICFEAKETIPEVVELLKMSDDRILSAALYYLNKQGEGAKAALPEVKKLLQNQNPEIRRSAVWAFARINPDPQGAVDQLLGMLAGEKDSSSRWNIMLAMRDLAPKVKMDLSKLINLLDDGDVRIQITVIELLGTIGPDAKTALPKLLSLLQANSTQAQPPEGGPSVPLYIGPLYQPPRVRETLAISILKISPENDTAMKELLNILHDYKHVMLIPGWIALILKSKYSDSIIPDIVDALDSGQVWERTKVLDALIAAPQSKQTREAILNLFQKNTAKVRYHAAFALHKLDPRVAQTFLPELIELSNNKDPLTAHASLLAASLIKHDYKKALPEILNALQIASVPVSYTDGDHPFTDIILETLDEMGADGEAIIPEIIKMVAVEPAYFTLSENPDTFMNPVIYLSYAIAKHLGKKESVVKALLPNIVVNMPSREDEEREIIQKMGRATIPELIQLFRHQDLDVRRGALNAIVGIWPDAVADAAVELLKMLQDPDPAMRWTAVGGLGMMGDVAKKHIKEITALLRHGNGEIRVTAAAALALLTPESKSATADLVSVLHDPNPQVRSRAATALGMIGPEANNTIPHLLTLFTDADAEVRAAAVWAVGEMPPLPAEAVKALVKAMGDKPWNVHAVAAEILHRSRPEAAKTAAGELLGLLSDKDANIRRFAVLILGEPWAASDSAIPKMSGLLTDKEPEVRAAAATALGKIGPKAIAAVPDLVKLFNDDKNQVNLAAIEAVGKIGPAAKSAIPDLMIQLGSKSMFVRRSAAESLGKMGPEVKVAITALVRVLGGKNTMAPPRDTPSIKTDLDAVYQVLNGFGPEIIPQMETLIQSPDALISEGARNYFDRRSRTQAFVAQFLSYLKHENASDRESAAGALGSIGPQAQQAVPELTRLMNEDPDGRVRAQAAKSLRQIQGKPDEP